jgi:hypothetical protein
MRSKSKRVSPAKKRVSPAKKRVSPAKKRVSLPKKRVSPAKKRVSPSKKELCKREKIGVVMKEFKEKKLKLRNKQPVTNPKQAIAIALSIADRNC